MNEPTPCHASGQPEDSEEPENLPKSAHVIVTAINAAFEPASCKQAVGGALVFLI